MSEKTDLSHYIPRRLDDGAKFLFWEMDVAMIGLMGVLVGIGSGFPVIGLFLGIGAAFFLREAEGWEASGHGHPPPVLVHRVSRAERAAG